MLDVDFPGGSTNAFATVSTVLSGVNAGSAERVTVWVRGVGITGHALEVYAEALSSMHEDINVGGVLDGEVSAADEGYAITPSSGNPTRLGTDRFGESNGRLDSEDRNGDGALDTDPEAGVALAGAAPLTTLALGDSAWEPVTLDIAGLVAANADTFRNLRGIRITVVPPRARRRRRLPARSSSAASRSAAPASLRLRQTSPCTRSSPRRTRISTPTRSKSRTRTCYRKLHGNETYRKITASPTVRSRARWWISIRMPKHWPSSRSRPPADLAAWKLLKLYVLVLPGNLPPSDASFLVSLASGSDPLEACAAVDRLPCRLERDRVILRRRRGGDGERRVRRDTLPASDGVVQRVSVLRFGLKAGASGISAPLKFFTDEWHVAQARLRVETAARVEASAGWRGTLLSAGGLPLVSDPFVSAGYEHRAGISWARTTASRTGGMPASRPCSPASSPFPSKRARSTTGRSSLIPAWNRGSRTG